MSAVGKTFNKALNILGMGVPDMPDVEKTKEAPDVDDKARQANTEREMARRRRGKGRAGTILNESSKLG